MKFEVFDARSSRSDVADWLELFALRSLRPVSAADFQRSDSVMAEPDNETDFDTESGEDVEREIVNEEAELFQQELWNELRFRESVLGDAYPFELITSRSVWTLAPREVETDALRVAHVLYNTCLMISALRSGLVKKSSKKDEEFKWLTTNAPNVIQAASYVAAAALLGGESHWFGWPRLDGTAKMRDALKNLVARVGHGRLKQRDPAWVTGQEKDGTIDVVVWRPFRDLRHGGLLMLGQVASGLNWPTKPARAFADSHFNDWFEEPIEHEYLTAMFMPFMLHADAAPNRDYSFDEVAEAQIRQSSISHGSMIDRVRLVDLVAEQLNIRSYRDELSAQGVGMYRWYSRALRALRTATTE
ncbi:hypothetical protein [Microbacterium sp. cx-59]|uniref:hypothetical protein n=1 Tax=Microbacterium sp. cx-59 TaxID=2891207 RepID=UPI001E2F419E|nr:hypothetical protein [Microbacterium sp. cx-59]MCC4908465.1 hypothetical protein [Microbacterium sp. cx-59]